MEGRRVEEVEDCLAFVVVGGKARRVVRAVELGDALVLGGGGDYLVEMKRWKTESGEYTAKSEDNHNHQQIQNVFPPNLLTLSHKLSSLPIPL